MSDKMRWRYGDTNPVQADVDSDTVIEIGDLLSLPAFHARPASLQVSQGCVWDSQELFARHFLGVAMERSRADETDSVRVATTGVFEFDCPGCTFELGELVGASFKSSGLRSPSGNYPLLNQEVARVIQSKQAVGRVARRVPVAAQTVLVAVHSRVMSPLVG